MTTLIQYLQRVLIVAIPAVLVFLCFTPYRMKALSAMNLHTSRKHEAGLILFVTSIFGVLALTLWPTYIWMDSPGVWGDIRILIDRPTWKSNLSLIPFTVFNHDKTERENPRGIASRDCGRKEENPPV